MKKPEVTTIVPTNDPITRKWVILHDELGLGFQVFVGPVHHGLAASYIQDIKKGYKGGGQWMMVEIKEIINVLE